MSYIKSEHHEVVGTVANRAGALVEIRRTFVLTFYWVCPACGAESENDLFDARPLVSGQAQRHADVCRVNSK